MIKSFCKKEDFQSITDLGNKFLIKFSKETIMSPVFEEVEEEVEIDGEIKKIKNMKPTGEYYDSGLVSFVEDYIFGELSSEAVLNDRLKEIIMYGNSETAEYHSNELKKITTVDELLAYDIHREINNKK